MSALQLARPEIAALQSYETPEPSAAAVRLNANEAPDAIGNDAGRGLNRYPSLRPTALTARLAELFAVSADRLLPTRGSSEAIDLLMRTFCRPYTDNAVIASPSFVMYRVYAEIQGIEVIPLALDAAHDFSLDRKALLAACTARTKLIILCSPNNPSGTLLATDDVLAIADASRGRSLVVIDEAYIEFSGNESLARHLDAHDNLVVLRTLSKAWGLAGARCGAAIGTEEVIGLLARIVTPYAFSSPTTDCVLRLLGNAHLAACRQRVATIVTERQRLQGALAQIAGIEKVWPSDSNFLLVRFADLPATMQRLNQAQILIRDFSNDTSLASCARITVGNPAENDALLSALRTDRGAH